MHLSSTTTYKRPRNIGPRPTTWQTPRTLGEPDTSPVNEEEWKHFEQRRHRYQPPTLFDEAVKKFEKLAERSSASRSAVSDTEQRSKVSFQDLRKSDSIATAASMCIGSGENQLQQPLDSDIGLRKARFYDSCLRADRSVEAPRLTKAPGKPLSAREPRASVVQPAVDAYPASSNDRERLSVTGSPTPRLSLREVNVSPLPEVQEALPLPGLSLAGSLKDLMVNCRQKRLAIATTGLVRAEESKERLDLEFGFLTDTRAEAMNLTVKAAAADVKDASFRSNSLTDKGVKHVLDALPDEVEKIDLSLNDLSRGQSSSTIQINRADDLAARSGWCNCFKRFEHLTALALSDCQIGDGICGILCDSMRRCRSLVSLNLSGNNLSKSGSSIRNLIKSQKKLEHLHLQWNQLAGESAILVMKGLIDICKLGGGQLRSLDLSYNPLGKEGGEEIATQLAKFFGVNKTLLHLDISKCDFSEVHCQILADGLKENTTLLGLHLDGNEARLDSRGFMIVEKLRQPPIQSFEASGGAQRQVERHYMIAENVEDRCWICERWEETRISYTPGISGPDAADVWVFTSLDDFEQPLSMQRVDDEFVVFLLAPPGPLFYCFQAGKELLASRTAPSMLKSEMHLLPAHLRSSTVVATGGSFRPQAISSTLRLKRFRLPTELDDEAADADSGKDPLVVELPSLSRHHVGTTRPLSSSNTDDWCCKHFIPRRPGEYKGQVQRQEWSLQTSLFAPFTEVLGNRGFCESCFEVDWKVSGIGRLFKDEADRSQVRDILRNHYAELKVLYNSLCSVDFTRLQTQAEDIAPLSFGVGLHEFTHMIVQHNLVSQDFTLAEVDAQFFIAAATPTEKATSTWIDAERPEGRFVQRHAFFELLVRIALARFLQADAAQTSTGDLSRARAKVKTASKAIEQLFKHHIMYPYPPMKNNFKCVQWRVEVLQTEVVETVLRKHMKASIDPLFFAYSRKGGQDQQHYLRPEDWFQLLDALDVFPYRGVPNPQTAVWDRVWLWQSSAMAQIDELRATRHLELTFVEFLEAISRLVGLLHSRRSVEEGKAEDDDWNYGMSSSSASSVFCVDQGVMSKEIFARYLDTFLQSSKVKQAIEQRRVD